VLLADMRALGTSVVDRGATRVSEPLAN
jgi:hypothetical protein